MTKMDDVQLWRRYEPFGMRMGLGFWTPALVTFPFGTMTVGYPGDGAPMSCDNLAGWTPDAVIDAVEDAARRWENRPEFRFSPSWPGDAGEFQKHLAARGYVKTRSMFSLVLENLGSAVAMPKSDCAVEVTRDSAAFESVFQDVFPTYLRILPAMSQNVASRRAVVESPVFLARDKGSPVGIVGACYEGEFGYMHSLGIIADCRGRGIGKHLVRECLLRMRDAGVRYVTCNIAPDNEASLAVQKRAGYRVFSRFEIWGKAAA